MAIGRVEPDHNSFAGSYFCNQSAFVTRAVGASAAASINPFLNFTSKVVQRILAQVACGPSRLSPIPAPSPDELFVLYPIIRIPEKK
jgi:hypothetical protein